VRSWSDLDEYRRLLQHYFGLPRGDHQPERMDDLPRSWKPIADSLVWRGRLSRPQRPGMLSTRPQFHWTDQKLHVHAFMCGHRLFAGALVWWRARRDAGFTSGPRNLLAQLARFGAAALSNTPDARDAPEPASR